jgi:hypothetical protein
MVRSNSPLDYQTKIGKRLEFQKTHCEKPEVSGNSLNWLTRLRAISFREIWNVLQVFQEMLRNHTCIMYNECVGLRYAINGISDTC